MRAWPMARAALASAGNGGTSSGRRSAKPCTGQRTDNAAIPSSDGAASALAWTVVSLDASATRITLPASRTASTSAWSDSGPVHVVPPISVVALSPSENSTS